MDVESQSLVKNTEEPPRWMTYLPLLSLLVGLCAFGFQVFVLQPWHEELSLEFKALARKCAR